jgi:hypothetical protein
MRIGRIAAVGIAAVLVIGALTEGVATGATDDQSMLCVHYVSPAQDGECVIDPNVDNNSVTTTPELRAFSSSGIGLYDDVWIFPAVNQTDGIFDEYLTNDCLQVNGNDEPLPDQFEVRIANCNGDAAEMWTNLYINERTVFMSVWDPNLCLTADYSDNTVRAEACVDAWYQEWGTS